MIKSKKEYERAKKKLREHMRSCNCFLPNISCTLEIDQLKHHASEYYLYYRPSRKMALK